MSLSKFGLPKNGWFGTLNWTLEPQPKANISNVQNYFIMLSVRLIARNCIYFWAKVDYKLEKKKICSPRFSYGFNNGGLEQIGLLSICLKPNQILDICFLNWIKRTQKEVIWIVKWMTWHEMTKSKWTNTVEFSE